MTEDMIQEQEDLFESLGSSADAAKTRAEVQCAQLLSGTNVALDYHVCAFFVLSFPIDAYCVFSLTMNLLDMSAFKASNSGCILGDFIRWHSPKDWDDEKSQLSARMAESGNFWQELWEVRWRLLDLRLFFANLVVTL
jgi:hypothetical protein